MFATAQIKEHMEVVGSDGAHVGTVDHMEGDEKIKLATSEIRPTSITTIWRCTLSIMSTTRST